MKVLYGNSHFIFYDVNWVSVYIYIYIYIYKNGINEIGYHFMKVSISFKTLTKLLFPGSLYFYVKRLSKKY